MVRPASRLQLIRKPDRDWNIASHNVAEHTYDSYNSLENPIGIETRRGCPPRSPRRSSYNSLENPIGIETQGKSDWEPNQSHALQLIRKPDRDWNR